MDGGAWKSAVHGVAERRTWLSDFTFTFHFHALEKEMATLQCSCLENPRGRRAWWAAVYGVAQSRIRLKWLSSDNLTLCRCHEVAFSSLLMPLDTQLESNIKILPMLWIRSSGSCVCMFRHSVMSDSLWLHGVAHQALMLMGFPSQEYSSGLPFPTPGDVPDSGIEHMSSVSPSVADRFFNHWATWEAPSDSHPPAYFQHLKEQFPSYYFVENTIIITNQQVSLAFYWGFLVYFAGVPAGGFHRSSVLGWGLYPPGSFARDTPSNECY